MLCVGRALPFGPRSDADNRLGTVEKILLERGPKEPPPKLGGGPMLKSFSVRGASHRGWKSLLAYKGM